ALMPAISFSIDDDLTAEVALDPSQLALDPTPHELVRIRQRRRFALGDRALYSLHDLPEPTHHLGERVRPRAGDHRCCSVHPGSLHGPPSPRRVRGCSRRRYPTFDFRNRSPPAPGLIHTHQIGSGTPPDPYAARKL